MSARISALLPLIATVFSAALAGDGATFQEQSARLQNINAYLLDFRPAGPPVRVAVNGLELALDATPQPTLDTRVGRKDEPLDPPSIAPKLRVRWLHRSGFFAGAAYAPGVAFQDYDAEYLSLEAGFRFRMANLELGLRASYSDGDVTGPITETNAEDFFVFENRGVDLSAGLPVLARARAYLFLGYNDIETGLEVASDGAFLANADETAYGGAGFSYRATRRLFLNVEQNVTDSYLRHLVLSASYRF